MSQGIAHAYVNQAPFLMLAYSEPCCIFGTAVCFYAIQGFEEFEQSVWCTGHSKTLNELGYDGVVQLAGLPVL